MNIPNNGIVIFYKIRLKATGEYARAGTQLGAARWSTRGKVFTPQTLKLHMSQFNPDSPSYPYKDDEVEIVQYIFKEEDTRVIAPSQF